MTAAVVLATLILVCIFNSVVIPVYCAASLLPSVANSYATTTYTALSSTTTYSCSLGYQANAVHGLPVANCTAYNETTGVFVLNSGSCDRMQQFYLCTSDSDLYYMNILYIRICG